ncbi:ankyrin repeat domain-containing protein [bacterium]|nr:MAG: ankyrin repeat domain-containing protein [bacterium]
MNNKFLGLFLIAIMFATTAASAAFPLHEAAGEGGVAEVERLLVVGDYKVDDRDADGNTPLRLAAQHGKKECVKKLLELGANADEADKWGNTILHWAVINNHSDIVTTLLAIGVDVNVADNSGWTPLHMAARNGYNDIITILVEGGADVNAADKVHGSTPLDFAGFGRHYESVVKLLQYGARVHLWNSCDQCLQENMDAKA